MTEGFQLKEKMKVGFSRVDVTPPLDSEVPGGFTKNFLSDIHDPLNIKSIVLENNGVRVALVSVDSLSIKASTVRDGRQMAEKITGIPSSHIMVAATHTHEGGPVVDWAGNPEDFAHSTDYEFINYLLETGVAADKDYLRFLSRKISSAVTLADRHKVEAKCAVGVGKEPTVSFNRRFKMKNGRQMTHPGKGNPDILEPAGPINPDVGVLSAWGIDGKFIGCVVNFACHGTTGPSGYSADWPHYLDKTIRGVMGYDTTVVFLNGACGDITQVDNQAVREPEFGEKWARRVGQKVGAEALKVIAEAEQGDLNPLNAEQTILNIETRKVPPERLKCAYELVKSNLRSDYRWYFARDIILLNERNKFEPSVPCEIQAIQIGPVVFVSSPAEFFCQLGLDIKSASPFPYTFVVELANGIIGYVPTEEAMGPSGGGYEARMGIHSKLVPSAGRKIVEASLDLIKKFTPGKVPEAPKGEKGMPWNYGEVGPEEV
jgi:neutral ceramidase